MADNAPGSGLGSLTVSLDIRLAYGTLLESAVRRTLRGWSLGLVCIENLRSDGRSGIRAPRSVRERWFVCESRNPYSLGTRTRSASAVVAIPGSITMSWIVFPDWATIICRCTGGWLPLVTVNVPVQSGFTE